MTYMSEFDEQMTALADAIRNKTGITKELTILEMVEAINSIDTTAFGVINSAGDFQALDLAGELPNSLDEPLTISVNMYNTGMEEPTYDTD